MDLELKAYLDGMKRDLLDTLGGQISGLRGEFTELRGEFNELRGEFNGLRGEFNGLRGEFEASKLDLHGRIDETQRVMIGYIDETKRELREHAEAVETRLLNAFWKWARTSDMRYRQIHGVTASLEVRVQEVEDRVSELERRPDNSSAA